MYGVYKTTKRQLLLLETLLKNLLVFYPLIIIIDAQSSVRTAPCLSALFCETQIDTKNIFSGLKKNLETTTW